MLNICFTADHEMFFGQNLLAEEEVFIKPTYRLMEVLERYQVPLCLMTDVCSVQRYRELKIQSNYVASMEKQLREAISRGHDVQLHLHPHWLSSDYIDGSWKFDHDHYKLHSFGFDQNDTCCVQRIIAAGKKYLLELLSPLDPQYDCVAFRAGGWCLQPERELLAALVNDNIWIDTTIYPGGYNQNPVKYYDFRNVPQKANWWISPEKGLNHESSQAADHIFEVPIGAYSFLPLIGFKKLYYKKYRLQIKSKYEAPRGTSLDTLFVQNKWEVLKEKLQNIFMQPILFTYDGACQKVMADFINYYLQRFNCVDQEQYISIIGHPKVLTETSLREIDRFLEQVCCEKSKTVRFIRLRDILV